VVPYPLSQVTQPPPVTVLVPGRIPRLFISVPQARDLVKASGLMGLTKANPYCIIDCRGRRYQTHHQFVSCLSLALSLSLYFSPSLSFDHWLAVTFWMQEGDTEPVLA
jgi:hypothetical protein